MENKEKDFYTFYFIESHLKYINNTEILLSSSHKYLEPVRKIMEKEFKDKQKQEFIVSVYGINIKPALIKKKEIKVINQIPTISENICLKIEKNKFETKININLNCDTFNEIINFEKEKKIFGKDIPPPIQYQLSNLEIMQLFNEALVIKERKKNNDPTYIELVRYGFKLISNMQSIELVLFLMIYIDIIKGDDLQLIKGIFDIFNLEKLIRPLKSSDLACYQERLDIIYNEQIQIFEKIKKIPNYNLEVYLTKFYTIYINIFFIVENYENCEQILKDLRDNNPFDKMILPKLYLSQYSTFYRNIPISTDLQNSLMGKFIETSTNYNNLLTSFSLISEYIKKDFVTMLLIINDYFPKIYDICSKNNKPIKINDYIAQNLNDDISKIQYYLDLIVQKKLENNFKTIDFNVNMWDIYINNKNNINFWEYIKSKLIIASLSYNDIVAALSYIIKFTNKDFIEMLDLLILNYDKIRYICMREQKQIIIGDYIMQKLNDNQDKIKEDLNSIITQKLKDKYETIFFNVDIWNYYVFNNYQNDFLTFLEVKLYEQAINSKDIYDCIIFSSNFRKKSFISLLEIILYNFDKIQKILKFEKKNIDIEKYIVQQVQVDDLSKIFELIKIIIGKEILNLHCSVYFNENIWLPYSQCEILDTLRYIRIILMECKKMQPELDENKIFLPKRIHDVGFSEIQRGTLDNEKMLGFLGKEEAFYVDYQIRDSQLKINNNTVEISQLKKENESLKKELNTLNGKVISLKNENTSLKNTLSHLEGRISSLSSEINSVRSECSSLRSRIRSLESRSSY